MPELSTIIGSVGVSLLLLAFFLNVIGRLSRVSRFYAAMNLLGAALSGYASWLIAFWPFVVLEGTWALVALVALIRPPAATKAN